VNITATITAILGFYNKDFKSKLARESIFKFRGIAFSESVVDVRRLNIYSTGMLIKINVKKFYAGKYRQTKNTPC